MDEHKSKMKKKLEEMDEQELIYTLLAKKVGSVDPKEVFFSKKMDSGPNAGTYSVLLGGKKLTPNQITGLQQEAMMLERTEIWKVFVNTLKHEAELRMLRLAKNERDMDWGKSIMHAVGIFETLLESIKNAHVEAEVPVIHRKN